MEIEKVKIGKNGAVLTAYIQKNSPRIRNADKRAAVLVLPGGGYEFVSDPENEPVALEYSAKGFQAFTLEYSVGDKGVFPIPQMEAAEAIAVIRANSEKWFVDGDKIALLGFSAGGHLAASVGVHWPMLAKRGSFPPESIKPNALILVYPCITAEEIKAVHGRGLDEETLKLLRLYNYVGAHTPPSYLCHSAEDSCVPATDSLLFASALAKNNIPFETHIFKNGPHGLSLANRAVRQNVQTMSPELRAFLKDEKIVAHVKKSMDTFCVWVEESERFLYDVFSM